MTRLCHRYSNLGISELALDEFTARSDEGVKPGARHPALSIPTLILVTWAGGQELDTTLPWRPGRRLVDSRIAVTRWSPARGRAALTASGSVESLTPHCPSLWFCFPNKSQKKKIEKKKRNYSFKLHGDNSPKTKGTCVNRNP